MAGNVDCYQPLEASYGITRGCLEVCRDYRNPLGIITKGTLVRRDLDILSELARNTRVRVYVTIPFADAETARLVEPGAPAPSQRFETLRGGGDRVRRLGVAYPCRRLGMNAGDNLSDEHEPPSTFRRPKGQGELFA